MKLIWHNDYLDKVMFAPDGGVSIADINGTSGEDTTDYKALYEQSQADYAKLKSSFDKTSSEISALKKERQERMSDEEKRNQELADREEHYKAIERENAVYKYKASLSGQITDPKVLQDVAELYANGEISKAIEKQNAYLEQAHKELEKRIKADLLKENPQPTPANGDPQKSFGEMTLDERISLKQKDPQLYEKLKNTK